jgi:hypothetical protein
VKRDPLGQALRDAAIPVPAEAETRGLRVVEAAYAQRQPQGRQVALPRLALAFAVATLLTALLLSPAGAAVRNWVDDVVTTSAPRPEPELAEIPGGGRLLVQSAAGPWVVQPDGSRRLLGDYDLATWSPRGLFVAAVKGRTLSAVEPDGDPRWSITAPGRVADPRWSPSPGYRIAYRSGGTLRMVGGDGDGDRTLARSVAAVAPTWSPLGDSALAYVSAAGTLRIVSSDDGSDLAIGQAGTAVKEIEWGAGGSLILERSPGALRLQAVRPSKLEARPRIGDRRELPVPAGATVVDAALAPESQLVGAVLTHWRDHGTRSSVVLFGPDGMPRRLLTVPGSLGQIAWSPDGRRLLVAWPYANQWLFLPIGKGQGRAVANVSRAFAPGGRAASFPRVEGWCCRD